jgi:hypothetical protein
MTFNNQSVTKPTITQDAIVKTNAGIANDPIVTRAILVPKNSLIISSETTSSPFIFYFKLLTNDLRSDNFNDDK